MNFNYGYLITCIYNRNGLSGVGYIKGVSIDTHGNIIDVETSTTRMPGVSSISLSEAKLLRESSIPFFKRDFGTEDVDVIIEIINL